jgi:ferredoxin
MSGQIIVVERPRRGLFAGVRSLSSSWRALWRSESRVESGAQGEPRRPRLRALEEAASDCAACAVCVAICPSRALALGEALEGGLRGQASVALWLDLGRCIGCGLCVEACPEGRLEIVALASPALDPSMARGSLVVDLFAEGAGRRSA